MTQRTPDEVAKIGMTGSILCARDLWSVRARASIHSLTSGKLVSSKLVTLSVANRLIGLRRHLIA